ncbi:helix-turn-helix domain-containing protein [Uliginosibacterium gangwonense]|uniref:helix-turn-helix domain-containing protein n=1 Tax=Uliginosibacterium gangwonense TaxID=392736 RepID=UPI00037BE506|nr:XRE family transcriptional regulator [Uliginosibacterium gangwonense]
MHRSSESTPPSNPQDVNLHLAGQLRQLRLGRGWSLDQAAQATGVSKAMLGQIERGESSPTVATLWKIATGFGCALTSFLGMPVAPMAQAVFRDAAQLRSKPATDDMLVATLFPYDPRFAFELMELTLQPGYVRQSEAHAAGVTEHVIVLRGKMDVWIDGAWQALVEGAAVRFSADQPHGYRNLHAEPAVCHDLIHYPSGMVR